MSDEWSDKWPDEPGHYWFYQPPRFEGGEPRTRLAKVAQIANGLAVYAESEFLYPDTHKGKWQKATLPEPPTP